MAPKPEDMAASMRANLPEKTGRGLEEWKKLLAPTGLTRHGEIVAWLKREHGVTHGYANLISQDFRAAGDGPTAPDDLVDKQYEGPKSDLRSIYDRLVKEVRRLGDDVELSPKKSYVSLRRSKQFALVQPSTRTRVDVGIQLPDTQTTERLEASGSFNSMVSHRVRLQSADDVDAELLGWLREAYERA